MPLYDFTCFAGHQFERHVPLAQFGDRQLCVCGSEAKRDVCAPAIRSDTIAPIMGADGKMHDSMASYRHSLTPEGNPRGERYHEVGNEQIKPYSPPPIDDAKLVDTLRKNLEDVKNNRVPPVELVSKEISNERPFSLAG